jgi:hypothetical protein
MRLAALLMPMALLLWSCEEREPTVIDGSSAETFARTTAEARRDIPDADRLHFDRALRTIGGRRHSARDADALARTTFDGMTGAQVVDDQKARQTGDER